MAVALAGCGSQFPKPRRPVSRSARAREVALLNAALGVEQHSIAAYTAAGPLLQGVAQKAVAQFLGQELRHAGILRKLVKDIGGRPQEPRSHYDLGHPQGPRQLLALLHDLEQAQLAAYLHAIALIDSAIVRQLLGGILANDAQHITVLRAEQGLPALTAPLLTAAE